MERVFFSGLSSHLTQLSKFPTWSTKAQSWWLGWCDTFNSLTPVTARQLGAKDSAKCYSACFWRLQNNRERESLHFLAFLCQEKAWAPCGGILFSQVTQRAGWETGIPSQELQIISVLMAACTEKPNQTNKKTHSLKREKKMEKAKKRWVHTLEWDTNVSRWDWPRSWLQEIKDPQFGGPLKKHRNKEWLWTPLSRQNALEFWKTKFSFSKCSVFWIVIVTALLRLTFNCR